MYIFIGLAKIFGVFFCKMPLVAFSCLSVQFSSVAQPCPTLCDPMNHSTPGLPVHHHLPEFTQTHIHRVGDAIQPRSKCLLISWLQSPSAVILEPQKIKSDTVSTVSPSISHEVMGPDAMISFF